MNSNLMGASEVCKLSGLTNRDMSEYSEYVKPAGYRKNANGDITNYRLYDQDGVVLWQIIGMLKRLKKKQNEIKAFMDQKLSVNEMLKKIQDMIEEQLTDLHDMLAKIQAIEFLGLLDVGKKLGTAINIQEYLELDLGIPDETQRKINNRLNKLVNELTYKEVEINNVFTAKAEEAGNIETDDPCSAEIQEYIAQWVGLFLKYFKGLAYVYFMYFSIPGNDGIIDWISEKVGADRAELFQDAIFEYIANMHIDVAIIIIRIAERNDYLQGINKTDKRSKKCTRDLIESLKHIAKLDHKEDIRIFCLEAIPAAKSILNNLDIEEKDMPKREHFFENVLYWLVR